MKNSEEMANASHTMDAIGDALRKRNVTSATIPQALKWVEEDANKPMTEVKVSWMQKIKKLIS